MVFPIWKKNICFKYINNFILNDILFIHIVIFNNYIWSAQSGKRILVSNRYINNLI
jgi:hypothetical protein